MNIFSRHPEYKNLFINPDSDLPVAKEGDEFFKNETFLGFNFVERSDFFIQLADWFLDKTILINDQELRRICTSLIVNSMNVDEIERIQTKYNGYLTDKEKYEYLTREQIDLDSITILAGYPKKKREYNIDTVDIFIQNELDILNKKNEFKGLSEEPVQPCKKIKWKGTPALFGYLFSEFVKNDFVETPVRSGEPNLTGFAKQCWEHFEIDTTLENLIKEMNPTKNTLTDPKRSKFPKLSDLA
jgi:hypothetical protein